jgi:hypothetical protein
MITDCISTLAGFSFTDISTAYCIFYCETVSKLVDTLETNSIYRMELVRANQRHVKIVNYKRNLSLLLSKFTTLIYLSAVMHIFSPAVHNFSTSNQEILQVIEISVFRK